AADPQRQEAVRLALVAQADPGVTLLDDDEVADRDPGRVDDRGGQRLRGRAVDLDVHAGRAGDQLHRREAVRGFEVDHEPLGEVRGARRVDLRAPAGRVVAVDR